MLYEPCGKEICNKIFLLIFRSSDENRVHEEQKYFIYRTFQCSFHLGVFNVHSICVQAHIQGILLVCSIAAWRDFSNMTSYIFVFKSESICFLHTRCFKNPHNQKSQGFNAGKRRGQVVGKFLEITRSSQRGHETLSLLFGLCEMVHHLAWIWKP